MKKAELTFDEALAGIRIKRKRLVPSVVGLCLAVICGMALLRGAKIDFEAFKETQTREEQWELFKTGCLKFSIGGLVLFISPLIVAIILPTKEEIAILKHCEQNEN